MTGTTRAERLASLEPIELDGTLWWRMSKVADALHVLDRCGRYVFQTNKRRLYEYHDGYRSKIITLINRHGVEQLVIRFRGDESRHDIMAALDAATQQRRGLEPRCNTTHGSGMA